MNHPVWLLPTASNNALSILAVDRDAEPLVDQ